MFNKEKIQQWFLSNKKKISIITAILLAFTDIWLTIGYFYQREDANLLTIVTRIIACFFTGIWIAARIMWLKNSRLGKFLTAVYTDAEKLYFHGFKMNRYIDDDIFLRLEGWLGSGKCYELSVLAMILLKNFKTARLCRGDYYDKDGNLKTRHSWVEVKVPFNGWYVVDFAWLFPAFCKRRRYFSHRSDGKLVRKWIRTYDEFWNVQFSNVVFEAMQNRKTSCVLLELSGFGNPDENYEFKDWILEAKELRYSDGSKMIPFKNYSGKPISTRIIRDFVKNPKRKNPKAKSIRLTNQVIHKYELWKAQQMVT